jgi:hypothetical protein
LNDETWNQRIWYVVRTDPHKDSEIEIGHMEYGAAWELFCDKRTKLFVFSNADDSINKYNELKLEQVKYKYIIKEDK